MRRERWLFLFCGIQAAGATFQILLYFGITPAWWKAHMLGIAAPHWLPIVPWVIGSASCGYAFYVLRKQRIEKGKDIRPASRVAVLHQRAIPPTEPILAFVNPASEGWISVHSHIGRSLWLNYLVFENRQFSTETTARNLVATLRYFHAGAYQFQDEGLWWIKGGPAGSGFRRSVSIASAEKARLLVAGQWPPDNGEPKEKSVFALSPEDEKELLPKGDWTVEVSIRADNCPGLEGVVSIKMIPHFSIEAEFHAAKLLTATPAVKATIS